jgi:hypothetical protein
MDLVQDLFIRTAAENYIHYALVWSLVSPGAASVGSKT